MKTKNDKDIRPVRAKKAPAVGRQARFALAIHPRRILVPVDFSDCSRKALDYALPFAVKFGATVTLLHALHINYYATSSDYAVFDYPELIDEVRRYGEKALGNLADSVRKSCPVRTLIETGHPGEIIVTTAKKLGTD